MGILYKVMNLELSLLCSYYPQYLSVITFFFTFIIILFSIFLIIVGYYKIAAYVEKNKVRYFDLAWSAKSKYLNFIFNNWNFSNHIDSKKNVFFFESTYDLLLMRVMIFSNFK